MLFNIWKTCWLSAQILPRGCWAWVRNSVAVRLTVRSLSGANTLFIRLSVCLFIWLSNYPSQQTPHHEPNVNTIVNVGHMSQLVGLLLEYQSQTSFKGSMLGCSYNSPFVSKFWENLLFCQWFVEWITYFGLMCNAGTLFRNFGFQTGQAPFRPFLPPLNKTCTHLLAFHCS